MESTRTIASGRVISPRVAAGIILALWIVFTLIYTWHPGDSVAAILELLPGLAALVVLYFAGLSLRDSYVQMARLSRKGAILLAASLLSLAIMLPTGRWVGLHWVELLVYAPASAVAQELFFRAGLLPALATLFGGKPRLAVTIHSLLFAAWHIPKTAESAPLGAVGAVFMVTFACGMLWGSQAQRDRTIVWALALHIVILMVNSFFTWG